MNGYLRTYVRMATYVEVVSQNEWLLTYVEVVSQNEWLLRSSVKRNG